MQTFDELVEANTKWFKEKLALIMDGKADTYKTVDSLVYHITMQTAFWRTDRTRYEAEQIKLDSPN